MASLGSDRSYSKGFSEGLRPDPLLTVTQWADAYRILPSVSSAEPGRWKTSRTPYSKEIMDELSVISPVQEIVFMKGAQVGATELGNNWMGYVIDYAPGPMMSVMPRVEDAKKNSKVRVQPLIDSCERLSGKVKEARSRDSGNTVQMKSFPGGVLCFTGANSAAGLRSLPVRDLFFDEVDAYPGDVEGEGDPLNLGKKRTNTFGAKRKIFYVSTPTTKGKSRIESKFNETDQRRYHVPCPSCGFMQWLKFKQLKWENEDPETAYYECEHCRYRIKNWEKTKMLAKGQWRATAVSKSKKMIGFHLSGLYSPVGWLSWEEIVEEWLSANNPKDLEKLKTFVNTVLGETWEDKGEAPEWQRLYKRREEYGFNTIPEGVCFLTAGVDVQKDRIEVEVVGWGRRKRSWSIDYRVFDGDTSAADSPPWLALEELLNESWEAPNGNSIGIKKMGIDSGYNTQTVYDWVRKVPNRRAVALKGSDSQATILNQGTLVDVKVGRRKIRRGVKVFTVGVSVVKKEIYGWLNLDLPEEPEALEPYGFCHFPEYSEDHFKRLTAETLETKWVKGRKRFEWVADGRNEQLDCRVYARAAASYFGMDRFKEPKWRRLEMEAGAKVEEPPRQTEKKVTESKPTKKKIRVKRRKSRFS